MTGLFYLAHLVQTKNDINRKRRRFHALILRRAKWLGRDATGMSMVARYPRHKSYTKAAAIRGYKQAQAEMKSMTAHMRAVRTEFNASFVWSDHGAISYIVLDNKRYSESDIRRLADCYRADSILLGDSK